MMDLSNMFYSALDDTSEMSEKKLNKMNMILNATMLDPDVENDSNPNISSCDKNGALKTQTDDSLFLQTIIATFTSTIGGGAGMSSNSTSESLETSLNDFSTSGGEFFQTRISSLFSLFFLCNFLLRFFILLLLCLQ